MTSKVIRTDIDQKVETEDNIDRPEIGLGTKTLQERLFQR